MTSLQKQKYVVGWEEKVATLFVDAYALATMRHPAIIGNHITRYYSFIERTDHVVIYYPQEAFDAVCAEHGFYFDSEKKIRELIRTYKDLIREFERLRKKQLTLLETHNAEAIREFYKEFFDFFVLAVAHFRSTRPEAEKHANETIRKNLSRHFSAEEIEETFAVITEIPRVTLLDRQRRSLLHLLQKENTSDDDLLAHADEFASFFVNMWSTEKIRAALQEIMTQEKNNIAALKQEVADRDSHIQLLRQRQKDIFIRCKYDKELIMYAKMMQDFGYWRLELKNAWAGSDVRFLPLFDAIANAIGASVSDLLNYYTYADMHDSLKNGFPLNPTELAGRKKCIAILVDAGRYELLRGEDALRELEIPRNSFAVSDSVKGVTGYMGRTVCGYVRKVYPTNASGITFNKGEILVTTFTQPSMVPIMSKAAAIVTDGGGITSHSAIVARELKIPCVIGTALATRIFSDGDYVEVDSAKGVVRKIRTPQEEMNAEKWIF